MPNQNERHWDNRVRTARKHLVERQLLDNSEHGVWKLTQLGMQARTASSHEFSTREREDVKNAGASSIRPDKVKMFKNIMIANRGAIACRVIKTSRRQGIGTSAVFSHAEPRALLSHVGDDAEHIGPSPPPPY